MNLSDPREHVQWKQPAVLLLDGDATRQTERAASLRRSGMRVECVANGASAAGLWEPQKYQLVLVELFEADVDVRPFCEYLQTRSPRQKIGIYCPEHPFILGARAGLLRSFDEPAGAAQRSVATEAAVARAQPVTSGLVEAARRIAVLRRRLPIHAKPLRGEEQRRQEQPKHESHAAIAARVLGSGS